MSRLDRFRRSVIAVAIVALSTLSGIAPVHAVGPAADGLRDAPADRRPTLTSRGTVDVASLPTRPAVPLERGEAPTLLPVRQSVGGETTSDTADTSGQPPFATTTTATPASGMAIGSMADPSTSGGPADPWVAAGPDHVIEVTDTGIVIWSRDGTADVVSDLSIEALFDLTADFGSGTPRVLYDALHGRWLMTQTSWTCDGDGDGEVGDPAGFVDLLVSRTIDPTGVWDLSSLAWDGYLPDDPSLGLSTDKIGIGSSLFELAPTHDCGEGLAYAGVDVTAVDWADVLASRDGVLATQSFTYGDGPDEADYFSPRVAVQAPATSATLDVIVQHLHSTITTIHHTRLTGTVAGGLDVGWDGDLHDAGVVMYGVEPPAPSQPGGDPVTTSLDGRPTTAIWQANRLTWVASYGCGPAGDSSLRACVRITQVVTASATVRPTLAQDFLIAEAGADHFGGGIAQSLDRTLHVVWTRSRDGAGGEPTSMTAYQRPTDPARSLSPRTVVLAGSGAPFTGMDFATATGVAQDPQVPNAVWQGAMASTGGAGWQTSVSPLQRGGATYIAIDPKRVLDSRAKIGLTGRFSANAARTFSVAGVGGIPADAVAVTANLTVTGQTAAGYVSLTTTPTDRPTTSTLNLPKGRTLANNVTIPLSSTGKLSAVYRAPSGATAHVILDVTGYFRSGGSWARFSVRAPTRVLDTRSGLGFGDTGPMQGGLPRRLQVADGSFVPNDAVAITANLTVVRPTADGFVSVTPTSQSAPTTSAINVSRGDVRANGLTAKLSGGGLWIVYRGSGGGTAHVVLDVTGYYRTSGTGLRFFPLTPGRLVDTRATVLPGLIGRFEATVPRTAPATGHWGIPAGAAAVTGNLTVTGQTASGYVGFQVTSTHPPETSTINVPVGDTRANGFTVPFSVVGGLAMRYVATPGATTHIVVDVTGYFR